MSMRRAKTVKGEAEVGVLVKGVNLELDAALEAARRRDSEQRHGKPVEPLRKLADIPENLRPFARYLANRNARPTTMVAYRTKAAAAQRYLVKAGMDPSFADLPLEEFPWHLITPTVAAKYWQILSLKYPNAKTRENLIGVVRRLVRECAKAGLISYADRERLLDVLPVPAAPMKRPGRELKEPEMRRLLAAKASKNERMNVRNSAIVALFLSTGLRVSEVAELRLEDVVFDERGAAVNIQRTKSGKAHFAWLDLTSTQYVQA